MTTSDHNERMVLSIDVPILPPTVNHMYTQAGKRRVLTRETLAFRLVVRNAVQLARAVRFPPDARLWVEAVFTFGSARRMDIDNRYKALQDALALALEFDDAQVDLLTVSRAPMVPGHERTQATIGVLDNYHVESDCPLDSP